MSDELESLAVEGRKAEERSGSSGERRSQSDHDYRRYLAERLVVATFMQAGSKRYAPLVFLGGLALAAIAAGAFVAAEQLVWVVLGAVLITILAGFFVNRHFERVAVREELLWVEECRLPINGPEYLDGLAEARMNTTVELSVTFAERPGKDERETIVDACRGAVEVAGPTWKKRTLMIESPQLASYFPARGQAESYYSNALAHRWFRDLIDVAISVVHKRYPISRIRVRLR